MSEESILLDIRILFESKNFSKNQINTIIKNVNIMDSPYDATKKSHAIAILTEWDEFKKLDYNKIYSLMVKPSYLFDGRKIMNEQKIKEIGFNYFEIGK